MFLIFIHKKKSNRTFLSARRHKAKQGRKKNDYMRKYRKKRGKEIHCLQNKE